MNNMITLIAEAILAFLITNIDDLIILLLFFSQINFQFRRRHIFIGQHLGFLIIIITSLPGFFGGLLVPRMWMGLLGILPIVIGCKQLINQKSETTEIQNVTTNFKQSATDNSIKTIILSIFSPQTYQVAAVTVANGGDNIGIYIPLFAGYSLTSLLVVIFIFLLMKTIWYIMAALLARQTIVADILSRYGKKIMPFFLIMLGLYIMYDRGTFDLLFNI